MQYKFKCFKLMLTVLAMTLASTFFIFSVGTTAQFMETQISAGMSNTVGMEYNAGVLALSDNQQQIEDFVTRFYQLCLSREPDENGLNYWVSSLMDGTLTGADVAKGFIFSQEFGNLNPSDDQYLEILYEAFFNRQADAGGYTYWLDKLRADVDRGEVLDGFIYSQEFVNLCDAYDITPYPPSDPVEDFVTRFYQLCLGRNPDQEGLEYWVSSLKDGSRYGGDVASGFVFSQEFLDRAVSNDEFLNVLYHAFFNRAGDPGGYSDWLGRLNSGTGRDVVLKGFIYAPEFANLCSVYGITAYDPHPFDGTWQGTALSTTAYDYWGDPCSGATLTMYITNSVVSGTAYDPYWQDWYTVSGSVNLDGTITAGLAISSDEVASFDGTLSGNSGGGSWTSDGGCRGTWSVSR